MPAPRWLSVAKTAGKFVSVFNGLVPKWGRQKLRILGYCQRVSPSFGQTEGQEKTCPFHRVPIRFLGRTARANATSGGTFLAYTRWTNSVVPGLHRTCVARQTGGTMDIWDGKLLLQLL